MGVAALRTTTSSSRSSTDVLTLEEWRSHVATPFILMGGLWLLLEFGGFDRSIAHALFYSEASGWLGTQGNDWWAHRVIHTGGSWFVRGVAAAALVAWLASFKMSGLAGWRREALFVFVAMAAVTACVGLLKQVTNVDCPWDLADFGGTRPYVALFANRPDTLPHAACFPGAHSSSGFSLLAFYFALRDRIPRLARIALVAGVVIGVVFSFGQQARGAHFLSHDLTSAAIAWAVLLALYASPLGRRAGRRAQAPDRAQGGRTPGEQPAHP
jgi:membrane-associated PAP2 superfamily phosphatase